MNNKNRIDLMKKNLEAMKITTAGMACIMEMGKKQREKELDEIECGCTALEFAKEYNRDLNLLEKDHIKLRKEIEELTDYHIKCCDTMGIDKNISEN